MRLALVAACAASAFASGGCSGLWEEVDRLLRQAAPRPVAPDAGRAASRGTAPTATGGAQALTFSPPASFAPVYRAAAPSVVNISAMSETGKGIGTGLRRLYEAFGVQIPHERFTKSRGTGFIVDSHGRVVTNWHIVEGTTEITVRYIDESERPARVECRDEALDLALLAVDAPPAHPALQLGDSDAIEVGEWVLAIGNAVGLGHTATAGIVSAKGRESPGVPGAPSPLARILGQRAQLATDFIQIDASINEGNAGGPLLDMQGRVVGVNAFFGEEGQGSEGQGSGQGIGFAIPAAALGGFCSGKAAASPGKAFLGVQVQDLTPELAESLKVPSRAGALVVGVIPGSPAEAAGFGEGDVLTAVDDDAVRGVRDLKRALGGADPATPHRIVFWRGGREERVSLILRQPFDAGEEAAADDGPPAGETSAEPERRDYLGLRLIEITPQNRARLKTKSARGVYVMGVDPDGPAGRAGIRKGDVIESCDGKPARQPTPLADQIQSAAGPARLYLRRDGAGLFVILKK